jgi:hypothetical protein
MLLLSGTSHMHSRRHGRYAKLVLTTAMVTLRQVVKGKETRRKRKARKS